MCTRSCRRFVLACGASMRNWLGPSELDMPVRTLDYGHITATSSYSWEHTRALLLFTVRFSGHKSRVEPCRTARLWHRHVKYRHWKAQHLGVNVCTTLSRHHQGVSTTFTEQYCPQRRVAGLAIMTGVNMLASILNVQHYTDASTCIKYLRRFFRTFIFGFTFRAAAMSFNAARIRPPRSSHTLR